MLIFTSAYIFLALTSWSVLAVPLPISERDNFEDKYAMYSSIPVDKSAEDKYAVYSSIPVDKSVDKYWGVGPAISVVRPSYQTDLHPSGKDSTPPDCGSKSKPPPHSGDKSDSKGNSPIVTGATPVIATAAPPKANNGPGPAIARRHFRDRMRRNNKASPSILGRDDPATIASNNPITFGDIVDHLIRKRAASRKRAERPRTSRGVY